MRENFFLKNKILEKHFSRKTKKIPLKFFFVDHDREIFFRDSFYFWFFFGKFHEKQNFRNFFWKLVVWFKFWKKFKKIFGNIIFEILFFEKKNFIWKKKIIRTYYTCSPSAREGPQGPHALILQIGPAARAAFFLFMHGL